MKLISIVIPCYNSEATIRKVVEMVMEEFKKMEMQMEEERAQIEKKIESYREKIKAVIQLLEEAWEE